MHTIFWDFGNVVAFFDHHIATRKLAEQADLPEEAIFAGIYGGPLEDDYESGRIDTATFIQRVRDFSGYRGTDAEFLKAFTDIFTPNPFVGELIAALSGRYRFVLASNCTPAHAEQFRRQFAEPLAQFHALGVSYEAGARKPNAAFYEHCQRFAAGPKQGCLFIDDIARHAESARQFGWDAIHYTDDVALGLALKQRGLHG